MAAPFPPAGPGGQPGPSGGTPAVRPSMGSFVNLSGVIAGSVRSGETTTGWLGRTQIFSGVALVLFLAVLTSDVARGALAGLLLIVALFAGVYFYLRYRFRHSRLGSASSGTGRVRQERKPLQVHHFRMTERSGVDYHCELVLSDGPPPLLHQGTDVVVSGQVRRKGMIRVRKVVITSTGSAIKGRFL